MESSNRDPRGQETVLAGFTFDQAVKHYRDLLSCGYEGLAIEAMKVLEDRFVIRMAAPHSGISLYLCWHQDVLTALRERCYLPIHSVSPGRRSRWPKADAVGQRVLPACEVIC